MNTTTKETIVIEFNHRDFTVDFGRNKFYWSGRGDNSSLFCEEFNRKSSLVSVSGKCFFVDTMID
jgi:hypothetical protein